MRKIAKIMQVGRINPSYYIDRDLSVAVAEAVNGWEDTPASFIGLAPETEAYEVWLVRVEDAKWAEHDTLPTGQYHIPPIATREDAEDTQYIYQPLLTGKRVQLHKNGSVVSAYDHKGRQISGIIRMGEAEVDISDAMLALLQVEIPSIAIFDAVVEAETGDVILTDILTYENVAAHEMAARDRMELLDGIEFDNSAIRTIEWSSERIENSVARPSEEGYFSKWVIVANPEEG